MRMRNGNDLSELERELELYLGHEFETGEKTCMVRARNTVGADVDVTFRVRADDTATVSISGYRDPKAQKDEPPQTIQLSDVKRNAAFTVVTGFATNVPTGRTWPPHHVDGTMRLEVSAAARTLVLRMSGKWGLKSFEAEPRTYTLLETDGAQRLITFISTLTAPVVAQLELEADADSDAELDDDTVDELEAGYGEAPELEEVRRPSLKIEVGDLRPGDVIVSTTRHVGSWLIRKGSRSKVSHAVLYMGDGKVMEALAPEPLGYRPLEEALADDKYAYALRHPGLTEARWNAMRRFALEQWEHQKRYDLAGALRVALRLRTPEGHDQYFCSEFVLAAYEAAGLPLLDSTQKHAGNIADLAGETLTYVGHLKVTKRQARKLARSAAREVELEMDDEELEGYEDEFEADEDELELETDEEAEDLDEGELDAMEDSAVVDRYARRLHELAGASFESEADLDEELDRELEAIEDEHFVRRVRRRRRRGKGKGVFGKILKAGAKIVGKIAEKTPVGSLVKAGTSLIRGDAKGALKNLAKAAVGTALGPVAGTVATTALDALGGEEGELELRRRRAVRRIARIARDTYRELADTLPADFDHPLVANEVVRGAVRRSMVRNGVAPPRRRPALRRARRRALRRVIRVRPDEEVVLVGGR